MAEVKTHLDHQIGGLLSSDPSAPRAYTFGESWFEQEFATASDIEEECVNEALAHREVRAHANAQG